MPSQIHNFDKNSERIHGFETDHIRLLCYDLPSGYSDTYRSYDAPRFCTIVDGEKHVKINQGSEIRYDNQSFILLPPHSNVEMFMPTHTRALVMEINGQTVENIASKVSNELDFHLSKEHINTQYLCHEFSPRMSILHGRIQDVMSGADPSRAFLADLVSQELIYELLKVKGGFELLSSQQNHPVRQAIRLMQQQPGKITSISSLAVSFNMSPANFNAQFKKLIGKTPNEFLTTCKMERSKQLLHHLSVTEVAFELGYENISHFIRLFKLQYGSTPKQYQTAFQNDYR